MRRQSPKAAAIYRKYGPVRKSFVDEFGRCMICGSVWDLCVHEITNGPNRMKGFVLRAAWLCLCGNCNCHVVTDKSVWSTERQLALKLVKDPTGFDLAAVQEILAPKRIDLEALVQCLKERLSYGKILY